MLPVVSIVSEDYKAAVFEKTRMKEGKKYKKEQKISSGFNNESI